MVRRNDIFVAQQVLAAARILAEAGHIAEAKSFLDFFKKKSPATVPMPGTKSPAEQKDAQSPPKHKSEPLSEERLKDVHRHLVRDGFGKILNKIRTEYVAKNKPLTPSDLSKFREEILQMFAMAGIRGGFKHPEKINELAHHLVASLKLYYQRLMGSDADANRNEIMQTILKDLKAISKYIARKSSR